MIKVKMLKRIITILLIFSLIYANLNMAIFGVVSYALDNNEQVEEIEEEKKPISIEISEFCRNAMLDSETEYSEKVTLNIKNETGFKEITVSDVNSKIYNKIIEEGMEVIEKETDTFYVSTKINKIDLINKIGSNGVLEIEYFELEDENEIEEVEQETVQAQTYQANQVIIELPQQEDSAQGIIELPVIEEDTSIELPEEEVIVLPDEEKIEEKGIVNAENGLVKINKDVEADDDGYITIIYPENTNLVNLKITTGTNQIEGLEVLNNKKIEKLDSIEEIRLETSKEISINDGTETLTTVEKIETPIYYTKTVAELGLDKTEISTSVDNKVNFTITMSTEKAIYDLYKNPQFIIELPSELETVNIDNVIILNNQYFEIETIEQGILENGNKAILIKLKGEQTEYTKSIAENIQILLETTIKTNELIPTLNRTINLHYYNENAKTYDGIGIQENGISSSEINLVSNSEIIVETKAVIADNIITSFREDYKQITIETDAYQLVQIIGTAINNTGADIQNAVILGKVSNMGQISGADKVYYTENENATADLNLAENLWSAEYKANAKKYLIVIDNFKQGQTITFEYNVNLPTSTENDMVHELSFDVYNNENIKTSKITINQKAKHLDVFADEKIQANIISGNNGAVEIGKYASYYINITNISNEDMKNVALTINVPEIVENEYVQISNDKSAPISIQENQIGISKLNILQGETVTIEVIGKVTQYISNETVSANIYYDERQAEVSTKMNLIEPAVLETSIVSSKTGKTLEANEDIDYMITVKNVGQSSSIVDLNMPEINNIYVQKIESTNLTTGKTFSIASGELTGALKGISIDPGETVEIRVEGKAKELKKESAISMYANITSENGYQTSTNQIVNIVSKKEESTENNVGVVAKASSIQGIAWIDKNENGRKDENENILKGVQATLINTENSNIIAIETTNSKGEYSFNNIPKGNYIVEFKYNTKSLSVTEYKEEEVEDKLDSDIISTKQNNEETAKTEVLELTAGKTENVNAGFVINKTFDMSINKGITKVTVNNEQGTENYEFDSTNMAKVEIEGKYLKGSLILVEYEIAVTNIGEIAGYAKVVSDKIPEGMKFNSELNTNWYQDDDGMLCCEELSNKELLPGETAIVKLVLTKEMTDDKVISPVNTVKLEETFNEYLIEDKKEENNSSEATIIISLTTGKTESYIWLALVVIAIIGTGAFSVIKVVNKDSNKLTNKERRK